MKKIIYFVAVLLITFVSSCLKIDSEPIATAESEQIDLERYLNGLEQNGKDIDTTDLGVYFIRIEEGEGEFPKTGDTLEVGYAGYFIDGTLFDASDKFVKNGTVEFVLGEADMIQGWNEGMKLMNKNAKIQFIVPSKLAYGSTGSGTIPPYKTLVFVAKTINIKPL